LALTSVCDYEHYENIPLQCMLIIPDFPDPIAPKITMLHSEGSCSGTVTMLHVLAFPNIRDILTRRSDKIEE